MEKETFVYYDEQDVLCYFYGTKEEYRQMLQEL